PFPFLCFAYHFLTLSIGFAICLLTLLHFHRLIFASRFAPFFPLDLFHLHIKSALLGHCLIHLIIPPPRLIMPRWPLRFSTHLSCRFQQTIFYLLCIIVMQSKYLRLPLVVERSKCVTKYENQPR